MGCMGYASAWRLLAFGHMLTEHGPKNKGPQLAATRQTLAANGLKQTHPVFRL